MAIISGRMTYSSFYVTAFSIGPLLGMPFYSIGGEKTDSGEILHSYHGESAGNLAWWSFRSREETFGYKDIRDMRCPGTRTEDWPGVPGQVGFSA